MDQRIRRWSSLYFLVVFLSIFSSFPPALAGNIDAVCLIGTGSSKSEAVNDAIEKAVESAFTVFIYPPSEVRNFRKVMYKIMGNARIYVKKPEVLESYKYSGVHFARLNVTVDSRRILEEVRKGSKAATYSEAVRSAAAHPLTERNEKYLEILKLIKARPVSDFYYFDFTRYEVLQSGTEPVQVTMTFRVAPNKFLWSEYYNVIHVIRRACGTGDESHIIMNYKPVGIQPDDIRIAGEISCLDDAFMDNVIVPRGVRMKVQLPNDIIESEYLFRIYDRFIDYRKNHPWIPLEETVQSRIADKAEAYYLSDDGFEFKIPVTISNAEHKKEIPKIKAYLSEAETGIEKFVWK